MLNLKAHLPHHVDLLKIVLFACRVGGTERPVHVTTSTVAACMTPAMRL